MERGVIYYNFNKNRFFLECLAKSVTSLKRHMPELPVLVYAPFKKSEIEPKVKLDILETINVPEDQWVDKISLLIDQPFEQALFLDADTYFLSPVWELFEMLERFDLVATLEHHYVGRMGRLAPSCLPELNFGVALWKKNDIMRQFFEYSLKVAKERKRGCDQPCFRVALWNVPVRYAVVPWEYNCRYYFPGYLYSDAKIIHSHSASIETDEKFINKRVYPEFPAYKRIFTGSKMLLLKKQTARARSMLDVAEEITYRGEDVQPKTYKHALLSLIEEVKGGVVAEVGVDKCRLLKFILKSNVAGLIREYWAIDHWIARTPSKQPKSDALYEYALSLCKWFPALRVLRTPSVEAARTFKDGQFDLVFIDADHSEDQVRADIEAWLPKVKSGGILCGHDFCELSIARHPGVAKAVREKFGESIFVMEEGAIWAYRKP
jgi:hypothetical protein